MNKLLETRKNLGISQSVSAEKLGVSLRTYQRYENENSLEESKINELIKKNPAYGQIICRCEMISEGQAFLGETEDYSVTMEITDKDAEELNNDLNIFEYMRVSGES